MKSATTPSMMVNPSMPRPVPAGRLPCAENVTHERGQIAHPGQAEAALAAGLVVRRKDCGCETKFSRLFQPVFGLAHGPQRARQADFAERSEEHTSELQSLRRISY